MHNKIAKNSSTSCGTFGGDTVFFCLVVIARHLKVIFDEEKLYKDINSQNIDNKKLISIAKQIGLKAKLFKLSIKCNFSFNNPVINCNIKIHKIFKVKVHKNYIVNTYFLHHLEQIIHF